MKGKILLVFTIFLSLVGAAQVGIGTTNPDDSSILDITASDKGILVPRVSLSSIATTTLDGVNTASTGLLIYNTNAAVTGGSGVGYYYFNGTTWERLTTTTDSSEKWSLTGDAGTAVGTNFLGTTDNNALSFRTNNTEKLRISTQGKIGIYNTGRSVFMGESAGNADNLSNNYNIAIGYNSYMSATNASSNTAVGAYSLENLSSGNGNVSIGASSMENTTSGSYNTVVGIDALRGANTGDYNLALGSAAMYDNTSGSNNIGLGTAALGDNTSGSYNVGVGFHALRENTIGTGNVGIGYRSLYNNLSGINNTALGIDALYFKSSGDENVSIGIQSGYGNLAGSGNVFLGAYSGYNDTGSNKLYIENSTADENNALIYGEFDNDFIRLNADAEINGRTEVTDGTDATGTAGTGAIEVANSLRIDSNEIITNFNTTLLLQNDNNGDLSVDGGTLAVDASANRVGVNTGTPDYTFSVNGVANLNEGVATGTVLRANGNEAIWFNGTYYSWGFGGQYNYFADEVGIGIVNPGYQLRLSTNSAAKPTSSTWNVISDARLKTNVRPFSEGLELLQKINPVWFTYNGKADMPNETGVGTIAQELQKIAPYMVKDWEYKSEDGTRSETYLGVDYGALDFVLINAIKEQQKEIETLKARLEKLEALLLKE